MAGVLCAYAEGVELAVLHAASTLIFNGGQMCYDLNEYDPFEPIIILEYDGSEYVDTEPMTVDDWDSWLEFNNGE